MKHQNHHQNLPVFVEPWNQNHLVQEGLGYFQSLQNLMQELVHSLQRLNFEEAVEECFQRWVQEGRFQRLVLDWNQTLEQRWIQMPELAKLQHQMLLVGSGLVWIRRKALVQAWTQMRVLQGWGLTQMLVVGSGPVWIQKLVLVQLWSRMWVLQGRVSTQMELALEWLLQRIQTKMLGLRLELHPLQTDLM